MSSIGVLGKGTQKLFAIKSFKKTEVKEIFDSLDDNINNLVDLILMYHDSAYNFLLGRYSKVANGQALHAVVYKNKKERASSHNMKDGLNKEDQIFLKKTFNSLIYERGNYNTLPFIRNIYMELIEEYIDKPVKDVSIKLLIDNQYKSLKDKIHKIIESYLKFVVTLSYNSSGMSEDNFQTGCMGLMKAIYYYEQKTKNSFASYAKHWIMNKIKDSAYKRFLIPIPRDTWAQFNKLKLELDIQKGDNVPVDDVSLNVYNKVMVTQTVETESYTESTLEEENSLMTFLKEPDLFDNYLVGLSVKEVFVLRCLFGNLNMSHLKKPSEKKIRAERNRQLAA